MPTGIYLPIFILKHLSTSTAMHKYKYLEHEACNVGFENAWFMAITHMFVLFKHITVIKRSAV